MLRCDRIEFQEHKIRSYDSDAWLVRCTRRQFLKGPMMFWWLLVHGGWLGIPVVPMDAG